MAILVIFLFPLLSRPAEPGGPRQQTGASLQAQAANSPARPVAAAREQRQDGGAEERAAAPLEISRLGETSLGLTLILGAALLTTALGSRGRPS